LPCERTHLKIAGVKVEERDVITSTEDRPGEKAPAVSTLASKFRARRAAVRRARAIERALATCTSPTMRDEILTVANRDL
jgi:hypothetical protein